MYTTASRYSARLTSPTPGRSRVRQTSIILRLPITATILSDVPESLSPSTTRHSNLSHELLSEPSTIHITLTHPATTLRSPDTMFPVDSLPATYYEEREAAEVAKRLATLQQQQAKAHTETCAPSSTTSDKQQSCLQRPQMSRPPSSSVLGNIFQGFVRSRNNSPPPAHGQDKSSSSGACTPTNTPPAKFMTKAQIAETLAEKKRDEDIVGFRAW